MTKRILIAIPVLAVLLLGLGYVFNHFGGGGSGSTSADSSSADSNSRVVIEPSGPEPASGAAKAVSPEGLTSRQDAAGGGEPAAADSKELARGSTAFEAQVISTGTITVRGKDVGGMRYELGKLLAGWKGNIASEQTQSDSRGRLRSSQVTVRVPSDRFDEAMTAIGRLGEQVHAERGSEDVTTQVLDVEARIRAQEKSLRRMEALLARANRIGEIVSIEAEVSRRQADLDSLKSQQAWLTDQTSMSTISIFFERSATAAPEPEPKHNAFMTGLIDGWTGLVALLGVLARALGWLLPFLIVLVPLGLVLRWAYRRWGQPRPVTPVVPDAPAAP